MHCKVFVRFFWYLFFKIIYLVNIPSLLQTGKFKWITGTPVELNRVLDPDSLRLDPDLIFHLEYPSGSRSNPDTRLL